MSVRWLLPLTGMALLSAVRPVEAATGPGAFQSDITLFRLVAIESVERSSGTAESDSTESKQPFFIAAAGAGVGIAAYFIASGGNAPLGGLPFTPQDPSSGGVLLPPQDFSTPPGNQPTGETSGGAGSIVTDAPTTVTPEPASMALLASGLAGLSTMTIRRRLRRP